MPSLSLTEKLRDQYLKSQGKEVAMSREARVRRITTDTLTAWGAVRAPDSFERSEYALEDFSKPAPARNMKFDSDQIGDVGTFMDDLKQFGLSDRHVPQVAAACMLQFDKDRSQASILNPTSRSGDASKVRGYQALLNSQSLVAQIAADEAGAAMEAFGTDTNRLPSDDRVTMSLEILRPSENIFDKGLARVANKSPIVTLQVPAPVVFDWAKTQDANATPAERTGNDVPYRNLLRNPSFVNTELKRVVPVSANDPGNLYIYNEAAGLYKTGTTVNTVNLSKDSSQYGFANMDRTDILSEGGVVESLIVALKAGSVTEYFKLDVSALSTARFVPNPSSTTPSARQAILPAVLALRAANTTQWNGAPATIPPQLTGALLKLNINFTSTLSLLTSAATGNGSVEISVVPAVAGGTVTADVQTLVGTMTATVVGYGLKIFRSEENQRLANLSIWMQYYDMQFAVPRGRVFFTDYSLEQNQDENVLSITASVMALGNGRRALDVLVDALSKTATNLTFATEYPDIALFNQIDEQSFASSLVKPTVVTSTIDFAQIAVAVMNESTRTSELHGYFRSRVLEMAAVFYAKSMMFNQYKSGERPVMKLFTHTTLADVLIGITEYHPELKDEAPAATGADYSMILPNGVRLDVIKTNWDCLEERIYMVPVIEADMEGVTSFGHIRDCGSVSVTYQPTHNGAVTNRIASTTREFLMVTNKSGLIVEVQNVAGQLGAFGTAPIALNADDSNNYSV
jgi:hypothetical protein